VIEGPIPGKGIPTEVSNLQGLTELDALWDFRNVCRRKPE
jgi:hypothetical protein